MLRARSLVGAFALLLLGACNESTLDAGFTGGIEASLVKSEIVVAADTIAEGGDTDVTLYLRDAKDQPFYSATLRVQFLLVDPSAGDTTSIAGGSFTNYTYHRDGRVTAQFLGEVGGTSGRIVAVINGVSIRSEGPLVSVISGVGVSITSPLYLNAADDLSSVSVAGTCSEDGEVVSLTFAGTTVSETCSSQSFAHNFDVSGASDGNLGASASHTSAEGETATDTHTVVLDRVNPSASISAAPAATNNLTSVSVSFSGSDALSGLARTECKIDAGGYATCNSPKTYSGLAAGSHTVSVRAYDQAGNVSAAATATWTTDLSGPVTTIDAEPDAVTNATSASFDFSAVDSGGSSVASFACRLDAGSYAACTSTHSLSGLAVGSHTFYVRATDAVGNVGTAATHTWIVDTTAPTVSISASPASVVNSTSASFTFSGSDTGGGSVALYECSLDGGAYAACTSPKSYTGLSAGSRTFSVRATDTAGNVSSAAGDAWVIDTTNPTATIDSAPAALTNSTSASFNFSGSDTGGGAVSRYECRIDAGTYATCTSAKSYTGLAVGSHTFDVRTVDTAGNTGTATSHTWSIDTTAPVISLSTLAGPYTGGNATTTASAVTINWTLTEVNAASTQNFTLEYSLDNGATWNSLATKAAANGPLTASAFSQSWTVPVANTAQAKVRVAYTDLAGNATTATSSSFTIDSTAPVLTSLVLAEGSTTTALPVVTASLSITNSGTGATAISKVQFNETGSVGTAWENYGTNNNVTLSQTNGDKTVYGWVRDAAGNVSADASPDTIKLDFGSPPSIVITSPVAGDEFSPGDTVPIAWSCSSDSGLAAAPISKIQYTKDDGSTFETPAVATNLTNNDSAEEGHYDWTLPVGVSTFRLLISCKSLAGVVSTAYSQPLNTGGWSVFMGDPWYGLTNVNATVANVSGTRRSSVASDSKGNIFYLMGHAMMRIDALSGLVTTFAGTIDTAGCTIAEGQDPLASGTNQWNNPIIVGTNSAQDSVYVLSPNCNKLYKVRASDASIQKVFSLGFTVNRSFLAGHRYLLLAATGELYKMDLDATTPSATKIHGTGTCATSVTAGANALTSAQKAQSASCASESVLFSNADTSKIWYQNRGDTGAGVSLNGYRLDWDAGNGRYNIGSANVGWEKAASAQNCKSTEFDNRVYCTPRSTGRTITVFDLDTETWANSGTLPFENNDESGYVGLGSSNTKLLAIYSLSSLQFAVPNTTATWTFTNIAGQALSTMGNGTTPESVGFDVPTDIKYNAAKNMLIVKNTSGHLRRVSFATSPYTVSTVMANAVTWGETAVAVKTDGERVSLGYGCSTSTAFYNFTLGASALSTLTSFMNPASWCSGSGHGTYPLADGSPYNSNAGGLNSSLYTRTRTPLYHSNGKLYFSANNGTSDVFIFSSDAATINRFAGKTSAGGYNAGDEGQLALGASLTRVHQMQELANGDMLIWDADRLRVISLGTAPLAPKISTLYSFTIAGSGYTAGTTFIDAYYDESSEIGGVRGTGNMYYVTSGNQVHKFVPNLAMTSASDTPYTFDGTTLSGTIRITMSPAGLLVLQPSKARILRVDP